MEGFPEYLAYSLLIPKPGAPAGTFPVKVKGIHFHYHIPHLRLLIEGVRDE